MGYDPLACFIACLCFSVTAWLCLSIRAYVRIHSLGGPFLDDILALIGTVIFTPIAVLFMIDSWSQVAGGNDSTAEAQMTRVKMGFTIDMLYLLGTFIMKLSFARTLSRIVQTRAQSIALAGIATIIRMPYVAVGIGANLNKKSLAALFWEFTELAINIICTSAATWKPLFYNRRRSDLVGFEQTSRKSPVAGVVGQHWPRDSQDGPFSSSDPVLR
ncbi:hypothetical protein BJY01DRAFT_247282 [Aspergillus pseudoustus]|uniref:Uncharacterized protein n=1 Tax=Aspergillus pseudoustus TaxID=1810923 RepID=A0ABR4K225_9EURO